MVFGFLKGLVEDYTIKVSSLSSSEVKSAA
jgi:hypothetical protein